MHLAGRHSAPAPVSREPEDSAPERFLTTLLGFSLCLHSSLRAAARSNIAATSKLREKLNQLGRLADTTQKERAYDVTNETTCKTIYQSSRCWYGLCRETAQSQRWCMFLGSDGCSLESGSDLLLGLGCLHLALSSPKNMDI